MSLVGFTLLGSLEAPSITGSASDVPLLVKPNTEFTTAMLASLDVGGGDLRFSSDEAGLTQLACEVVDGLNVVWVSTVGLSIATGTTIYVWGDNTGATQPAVGAAFGRNAVWVDYAAVIHANEVGTNGIFSDSTGNGHDTTLAGAALSTVSSNPLGGSWPEFTNTQNLVMTNSFDLVNSTDFTMSVWANQDVVSGATGILSSRYKAKDNNYATILGPNTRIRGTSQQDGVTTATVIGTDYLIKLKGSGTTTDSITNGAQTDTDPSAGPVVNTSGFDFRIGTYFEANSTRRYTGRVAEVRIKKSFDSPDFDSIEYDNQSAVGSWWIASDVGGGTITVTGLSQSQTIESPTLTQSSMLSVDSIAQLQSIELPSITQANLLSVDNITQNQTIDNISLVVAGALSVQGLSQSQVLQNAELIQQSILSVQSLSQGQTLDNAQLESQASLSVQSLAQSQILGNVTLITGDTIAVNGLTQIQLISEPGLTQNHLLFVDDLTQPQSLTIVNFGAAQDIRGVTVSFKDDGINVKYKADAITVSFR